MATFYFFLFSAAVKYMECMNKVVSICNSRSAFASESYTLSFINDTHNKLHELMSGYDCLSGKKTFHLALFEYFFQRSERKKQILNFKKSLIRYFFQVCFATSLKNTLYFQKY